MNRNKKLKYVKLTIPQYNTLIAKSNFLGKIVEWLRKKRLWKKLCKEFGIKSGE